MTSGREPDHLVMRIRPVGKDKYSGFFHTVKLDLELLQKHFALPFRVAAVQLGVCETALKGYE
jgi:hypothetical protein